MADVSRRRMETRGKEVAAFIRDIQLQELQSHAKQIKRTKRKLIIAAEADDDQDEELDMGTKDDVSNAALEAQRIKHMRQMEEAAQRAAECEEQLLDKLAARTKALQAEIDLARRERDASKERAELLQRESSRLQRDNSQLQAQAGRWQARAEWLEAQQPRLQCLHALEAIDEDLRLGASEAAVIKVAQASEPKHMDLRELVRKLAAGHRPASFMVHTLQAMHAHLCAVARHKPTNPEHALAALKHLQLYGIRQAIKNINTWRPEDVMNGHSAVLHAVLMRSADEDDSMLCEVALALFSNRWPYSSHNDMECLRECVHTKFSTFRHEVKDILHAMPVVGEAPYHSQQCQDLLRTLQLKL